MARIRAPCCDKSKVRTGPWSAEEDFQLDEFIRQRGQGNWRNLPKKAGLQRCGKSCRLRWVNYLRPDIKRGNFTPEEEQTIINLQSSFGNKWSKIAPYLPGRTDNDIKNVWNARLKKRVAGKSAACSNQSDPNMGGSSSPFGTASSISESGDVDVGIVSADSQTSSLVSNPSKSSPDTKESEALSNPESEATDPQGTGDSSMLLDGDDADWKFMKSLDPLQGGNLHINKHSIFAGKIADEVYFSKFPIILENELVIPAGRCPVWLLSHENRGI